MVELLTFVPRADLDAQANMAGFIDLCRTRLTVFGASLQFEADTWDVSSTVETRGRGRAPRLIFNKLATSSDKEPGMMHEPFKSFAKAYLRYTYGMRPRHLLWHMRALRALEAALGEAGTADPVQTTAQVLNRAAQLASEGKVPQTAYNTTVRLEVISEFLCDNALIAVATRWRNPIRSPGAPNRRVGRDWDNRREALMPSQAALDALPAIFRLATTPGDVLASSITAILCSAPDRINEVLSLRVNCEVRKKRESSNEDAYGLRWWPAKGAKPMVKWILPSMAGVVGEAIGKIRQLTEEARTIARWYEKNPDQLYLPDDLNHLKTQEWLSMREVAGILFSDPVPDDVASYWCSNNDIPFERRGRKKYVHFADVESVILKMLPHRFPFAHTESGLKYSDALFVIQKNALHATKTRFNCVIETVTAGNIATRLRTIPGARMKSIFTRHGFHEPDGGPINVKTHQLRHYLNTLAQAGGLSQLDIAKWSGRKDVRQNKAYDHETSTAIVARIRTALGDDTRMFGPLAIPPRAALIARDEFARLKVPTAHTTDFGYCIHDYVMSPCQMHRDCLNCCEQVCVKDGSEKEQRIRQAHVEATRLLSMAEQAEADGELGAAEWALHHRAQLARLTALLEILDDPAVPRGAFIQLLPADIPSRLDQAIQARAMLQAPDGDESSPMQAKSDEADK